MQKYKPTRRCAAVLFLCLFGGVFFAVPAAAWEPESAVEEIVSLLPDAIRDTWETSGKTSPIPDEDYYFKMVEELLRGETAELLPSLLSLFSVACLAAISERLFPKKHRMVQFLLAAGAALISYRLAEGAFLSSAQYLRDTRDLAAGLLPVFVGLYAAGGNSAAAISSAGAFSGFLFVLEILIGTVFLPVIRLLFCLSLLSFPTGGLDLSGISRGLRRAYTTALLFLSALFGAALSTQSLLASAKDSLTGRSLKFAVGSMIPVVGNAVSGALGTVTASVSYLRTVGGGAAVAGVLLLTLPVLLRLLILRLIFGVAGSASEMLMAGDATRIYRDFSGMTDLCLATVALSAVSLILLSTVLMKCAVPTA